MKKTGTEKRMSILRKINAIGIDIYNLPEIQEEYKKTRKYIEITLKWYLKESKKYHRNKKAIEKKN